MGKRENNILYKRIVRSYLSSVISISLVLFLVGVAGVFIVNARSVSDYFKENIRMSAILSVEVQDSEAVVIAKQMKAFDFVKEVDVISKEQGVNEMKELLGEDFLSVFESNPIPISLELKINADYISKDSLEKIEIRLLEVPFVEDIVYQESLVDLVNANLEKIWVVMSIFIALLLFISFVLINNTVRLNVYSKRFTIHTMRLVGATKGFISQPFLWQAFFQGLISGLIAVLGLLGVLYMIRNEFNLLFMIFDIKLLMLVLVIVVLLGIVLCVLSTFFVVRRLVSLTNDDLYY